MCVSEWEDDTEESGDDEDEEMSSEEEEMEEKVAAEKRQKKRNTLKMENTARMAARFDIKPAQVAAICNAYSEDRGVDLNDNPDEIISESSFRYKKNKVQNLPPSSTLPLPPPMHTYTPLSLSLDGSLHHHNIFFLITGAHVY